LFPVVHRPVVSNGTTYSLHHLQPFRTLLTGHGREGGDISIRVSYHSHVYSTADTKLSRAHRFMDEGGSWRAFSLERHNWSLTLPQICREMIDQNFPSWLSQDRNRQNNMTVSDRYANGGLQFAVFYGLSPSRDKDLDVELVVKSAFEKDIGNLRGLKRSGVRQLIKTCFFKGLDVP
jgi:hypothetical protein